MPGDGATCKSHLTLTLRRIVIGTSGPDSFEGQYTGRRVILRRYYLRSGIPLPLVPCTN